MVTFVITSCGRLDLLERTISSFLKYNTHPIERYMLIDDSADPKIFKEIEKLNNKFGNIFELYFNETKIGQTKSIDYLYNKVYTKYIFHCEDDWEFYRSGFMEKSIDVLEHDEKILQVVIRPKNDGYSVIISDEKNYTKNNTIYYKIPPYDIVIYNNDYTVNRIISNYNGFTYNPGLKRLKEYKLIHSYSIFTMDTGSEQFVDNAYRNLGYYVVTICENNDSGYIKHTGWGEKQLEQKL